MEGPSLFLAQEQLRPFKHKKVLSVSGNTKIDKDIFVGKKVRDIFAWGKHLVFQFDTLAFRVHFLLFGTFAAAVNGESVTGDYKKTQTPRLTLIFENGEIQMYNCSIKVFEENNLKKTYDFTKNIMSPEWDEKAAFKRTRQQPDEEIADVLLDQDIFAGVGNIIKNEILYLARVNPKQKVSEISAPKLEKIISLSQSFSIQFYEWRKIFMLKKNLVMYRKGKCPNCETKVIREKTGKRERWSYWCLECQS